MFYKQSKRVFGYIKKTIDYGLIFQNSEESDLSFYADSDWAGEKSNRKSRTGWVACLNGTAISWSSRKQTCIAQSTTEAEFIALSELCHEVKWLRLFMTEIGKQWTGPCVVYSDNIGAQSWANASSTMRRTKHIEVRHFFSQWCVQGGLIKPADINSTENPADTFTKPLDKVKFTLFRCFAKSSFDL